MPPTESPRSDSGSSRRQFLAAAAALALSGPVWSDQASAVAAAADPIPDRPAPAPAPPAIVRGHVTGWNPDALMPPNVGRLFDRDSTERISLGGALSHDANGGYALDAGAGRPWLLKIGANTTFENSTPQEIATAVGTGRIVYAVGKETAVGVLLAERVWIDLVALDLRTSSPAGSVLAAKPASPEDNTPSPSAIDLSSAVFGVTQQRRGVHEDAAKIATYADLAATRQPPASKGRALASILSQSERLYLVLPAYRPGGLAQVVVVGGPSA